MYVIDSKAIVKKKLTPDSWDVIEISGVLNEVKCSVVCMCVWDLPAATHKLEVRVRELTGLLRPVVTDLPRDWLLLPVFSLKTIRAEEVGLKGKIDLKQF